MLLRYNTNCLVLPHDSTKFLVLPRDNTRCLVLPRYNTNNLVLPRCNTSCLKGHFSAPPIAVRDVHGGDGRL